MIIITSDRIRSVITECKTEPDIIKALRTHKIKYSFSTDTGYSHIRIPCRSGTIRIYRTCSRSCPFAIQQEKPIAYPYPLPRYTWDD